MKTRIKLNIWRIITALIITSICCLINSIYDYIALDVICLALYATVIFLLFKYYPDIIVKYIYFIITSSWSVLAVFIIENKHGLVVGRMVSEHCGSLPPYIFSWIVFYTSICLMEKNRKTIRSDKSYTIKEKYLPPIIIYGALAMAFICFLLVAAHPSFLMGINRFDYRDSIQSSFSRNLFKYTAPLTPIMVLNRKKHKYICIMFIGLLCAYNIWTGEKYGGFIQILFFSMLGFMDINLGEAIKRNLRKIVVIAAVMVFSLLAVVYFQRMVVNPNEDFSSYLSERIASQGLTWWATYKGDHDKGWHIDEIDDELSVMANYSNVEWTEYNHGIYKQMKLFQNAGKVKSMLRARVRAAESTRATFFYYMKYLGLIIGQICGAFIIYRLVNHIIIAIRRGELLLSYFYTIVLRFFYQAFEQSDFYLMTTLTAIISYIAIFIIKRFKPKMIRRKALALDGIKSEKVKTKERLNYE